VKWKRPREHRGLFRFPCRCAPNRRRLFSTWRCSAPVAGRSPPIGARGTFLWITVGPHQSVSGWHVPIQGIVAGSSEHWWFLALPERPWLHDWPAPESGKAGWSGIEAFCREEVDLLQRLQALYGLFKPGVHFRQAAVGVGPYRLQLCALGLRLRKVDGAFSFVRSHDCLP